MPFSGVIEPEQLKMLQATLDAYCVQHGIEDDANREIAAHLITSLFTLGAVTPERLAGALDATGEPKWRV